MLHSQQDGDNWGLLFYLLPTEVFQNFTGMLANLVVLIGLYDFGAVFCGFRLQYAGLILSLLNAILHFPLSGVQCVKF